MVRWGCQLPKGANPKSAPKVPHPPTSSAHCSKLSNLIFVKFSASLEGTCGCRTQSKNRKSVDRVPSKSRPKFAKKPKKTPNFRRADVGAAQRARRRAWATLPASGDRLGADMATRNRTSGLTGPEVVFYAIAWPSEAIDEASQTMLEYDGDLFFWTQRHRLPIRSPNTLWGLPRTVMELSV